MLNVMATAAVAAAADVDVVAAVAAVDAVATVAGVAAAAGGAVVVVGAGSAGLPGVTSGRECLESIHDPDGAGVGDTGARSALVADAVGAVSAGAAGIAGVYGAGVDVAVAGTVIAGTDVVDGADASGAGLTCRRSLCVVADTKIGDTGASGAAEDAGPACASTVPVTTAGVRTGCRSRM